MREREEIVTREKIVEREMGRRERGLFPLFFNLVLSGQNSLGRFHSHPSINSIQEFLHAAL